MEFAVVDGSVPAFAGEVVFVGSSTALQEAHSLASGRGFRSVEAVADGVAYAVVDDDALDGICTPAEAALLAQVRALEVPVLTVQQARTLFRAPVDALTLA
ncbi:hypothetical protein [Prescottella subtropica]|uniref:hypothetical protein n=1 Tax=Prescottella subtropica TaxID=2545757 RepID=UPI0010F70B0F|nr:hypothetical protein [Prescottella subtropica]